jgi:hypothetical protein
MFLPLFREFEAEEPAVLVAADHDVAAFPASELDVFHELRLLAESHVRPDRSLRAVGYSVRERHRKERRDYRRPAVQVRRAAGVIPGVVLVRVKSPVDAPGIHVDSDHRVRVDMQLLVQVVAGHARGQAGNVRVGIAASAPGLLAVLRDLRCRGGLRHRDIDLAPLHIERRMVAVGRSAERSLGPEQRSQLRRQFMIGVVADVGVPLPENLPGIDIHGDQAAARGAARIVRGRVDRLDEDIRVGSRPVLFPVADRHEDPIAVPADRSGDLR